MMLSSSKLFSKTALNSRCRRRELTGLTSKSWCQTLTIRQNVAMMCKKTLMLSRQTPAAPHRETRCFSCCSLRNDMFHRPLPQRLHPLFVKRHCSQCTFKHGNIPSGFRSDPPWRVLFFGTDDFAVKNLDALVQIGLLSETRIVDTLEVVCNRDKKSPVCNYAMSKGLKVHRWPIQLEPNKYDVGVIVSFGHLIPENIIHMFPYGILNVHPSLLPRWRGASPIFHTVLNGDKVTGISIMEIRPKRFDIGPLLMQQKFLVPPRITSFQLSHILAKLGAHMLLHSLENLPWLEIAEKEQDTEGVTYAHKITSIMANIDWNNQTCSSIDCQYRALHELVRLKTEFDNHAVHLLDMVSADMLDPLLVQELTNTYPSLRRTPCGWPHYSKRHKILCIRCKNGWVGFKNIVIRKTMTAESFANGYLSKRENKGKIFKSIPNYLNKDIHYERMRVTA